MESVGDEGMECAEENGEYTIEAVMEGNAEYTFRANVAL